MAEIPEIVAVGDKSKAQYNKVSLVNFGIPNANELPQKINIDLNSTKTNNDNSDSLSTVIKNTISHEADIKAGKNINESSVKETELTEQELENTSENLTDGQGKNITDPKVLHDTEIDKPAVAKAYEPQNKYLKDGDTIGTFEYTDSPAVDGITYPIIQINNQVIDHWQIIEFRLISEKLVPELILKIKDTGRFEEKNGATQANNEIKVILLPKSQKTYRAIQLKFICDYVDYQDEYINFYSHYKFLKFYAIYTKMLTFPGCTSCPQPQNDYLNTWELCHQIANETGLGFAATLHTKEIEDRVGRYMLSQNYRDVLDKHNEWPGLDEDSVMDIWIDFYGYINLINLSWVLSQDIKANDLSIIADIGFHSKTNEAMKLKTTKTNRIITNFNMMAANNNLMIRDYTTNVDNDGFNYGAQDKLYSYKFKDHNDSKKLDSNMLEQQDLEIIQNTVDGSHVEEYETHGCPDLVYEPDDLLHCRQKLIKTKFLQKRKQKTMTIRMRTPNFGIVKGILIYIVITENDPVNKQRIFTSEKNVDGETNNENMEKVALPNGMTVRDIVQNESVSLINEYLSGVYFVDSVEYRYEYDNPDGEIEQYITVFKKDQSNGYSNKHTEIRVDYDAFQKTVEDVSGGLVSINSSNNSSFISNSNILADSYDASSLESISNNLPTVE